MKFLATRTNRAKLPDQYASAGVYRIQCLANGKFYIGSTGVSIRKRWGQHVSSLTHGKHPNPSLQASWNKYGESSFVFGVVEQCSPESSLERESHFIKAWKPQFNCGPVANPRLGVKLSAEQKAYISRRIKETMTPERRAHNRKISQEQDKTKQLAAMLRKKRRPIVDQDDFIWPSCKHACDYYNIKSPTITHHLQRQSRPIYGKYAFTYLMD